MGNVASTTTSEYPQMSNATERANARALPETTNRRAVLRSILAGGAVAATALPAIVANAGATADAEILALETEIRRLGAAAEEIYAKRVWPFEDEFSALAAIDVKAAFAFSRRIGREKAASEGIALHEQAGPLFERMMALPTQTQAGRAAKVRTFLSYVAGDDWRGPSRDLDWEIEAARKLLGEFAGMSEEELANV
jgi:hypothetical protein